MLDPELQKRISQLIPDNRSRTSPPVLVTTTAALTLAATFVVLIYVGEIHKIPISRSLARLETMLSTCTGKRISTVREQINNAPRHRLPSFSMAEKLQAIERAIDALDDEGCISRNQRTASPK
jgi:hypothetical protein